MSEDPAKSRLDALPQLFDEASDLPVEQRKAFLDARCGGDAALRAAVESLLSADSLAGKFLADPTIEPHTQSISIPRQSVPMPSRIGPYKILEKIGEGGFGTVYLAEQQEPVRRRVALKVIKLGMDTEQVIARFEAERQALAMMDHPNIARVFEAGATDTGRPYFVMELVRGVPITQYCDDQHLNARQRLELFMPVCNAVQHAHQKGVIHRDIKPSNVLVAMHDDQPMPKVIDFGVAKATQSRLTERTLFTEQRTMIGTPEYMSPEQADIGGRDIDTRSDVYSLGVLLYELLTGVTPFDPRELRSKAFGEMQRVIREEEPPAPSAKLSTVETIASIAANRATEPKKLTSQIRGELDWIVMRCLEKDRSRRYESVSALSADVLHHLSDEPVLASPAGAAYRLRKFARRHRLGLAVSLTIALALCCGLIIALYGLKRARFERDQAITARNEAEQARKSEAEARDYEHETDRFLINMFKSIDPAESHGKDVLVKDVLDAAAKRLDTDPPTHPLAEASLRYVLGDTYNNLGLPTMAIRDLERAVEIESRQRGSEAQEVAECLGELGRAYYSNGQLDLAEASYRRSLNIFRTKLGPDDDKALRVQRDLAGILGVHQKLDEADQLLSDVLAREQAHPSADPAELVSTQNVLATLRAGRGQFGLAIPVARAALENGRAIEGDDAPDTIVMRNNLAEYLRSDGQFAEAESIGRTAYEQAVKVLGPIHQVTLRVANSQALRMHQAGHLTEAAALYADTIVRMKAALGEDNPRTLLTRSNAALVLQDQQRLDEALSEFRDISIRMHKASGDDDANALVADSQIAVTLSKMGRFAEAEPLMREHLSRAQKIFGARHPNTYSMMLRLGWVLDSQGKHAEAEPLLAEAYEAAVAAKAAGVANFAARYGICLTALGKFEQAYPILLKANEGLSQRPGRETATWLEALDALAACDDHAGHASDAQAWRAKRNQIAQTQPASAPATSQPATSGSSR